MAKWAKEYSLYEIIGFVWALSFILFTVGAAITVIVEAFKQHY